MCEEDALLVVADVAGCGTRSLSLNHYTRFLEILNAVEECDDVTQFSASQQIFLRDWFMDKGLFLAESQSTERTIPQCRLSKPDSGT